MLVQEMQEMQDIALKALPHGCPPVVDTARS